MAGLIPIVFCDTNRIIMYLDVCFRLFFCCLWRGSACSRDVSRCIWSADLFVLHLFLAVFFRLEFMVLHICAYCLTCAIKQCFCCLILCVLLLVYYCICIVTSFLFEACVLHRFLPCVWHLERLPLSSFSARGFLLSRLRWAPQGGTLLTPWELF